MQSIHAAIIDENLHHFNTTYSKIWTMSLNVLSNELCESLITNKDKIGSNDTLELERQVSETLLGILPTTYGNCKLQSINFNVELNMEKSKSKAKRVYDDDGNYSKLFFVIYLNDQVFSNDSLTKRRYLGGDMTWYAPRPFTVPGIRGSMVLFDEDYEFESEPVGHGTKKLLVGNVIYNLTPESFLKSRSKEIAIERISNHDYNFVMEQIIDEIKMFERALKARAFVNKTKIVNKNMKMNMEMRFDQRFELCESCNSYINIKSKVCQFCNDELTPNYETIQRRFSGKW
jgi:hypothetical protein